MRETYAAQLYEKAARLALEINDVNRGINLLSWAGNSFIEVGRLKEALGLLYEALTYAKEKVDTLYLFFIMVLISECGILLPSSFSAVEEMIDRAKKLIH
jgi:hypothetical protein